ncbi:MAG: hypothetical protein U1E65_09745 [Myxococcota bacterium]
MSVSSGCLAVGFDVDSGVEVDARVIADGGNADAGNADAADASTGDSGITGSGPYCDVATQIFIPHCTACHRAGATFPDLSFDGARSVVGASSRLYGSAILVVANDPAASLLYRKMAGTQAGNEGQPMPTTGLLSAAELAIVSAWINAGAPTTCDVSTLDGGVPDGGGSYHPAGFGEAAVHGAELKLGVQDCRSCHGSDLQGASGPSCDSCHQQGWRSNCTFCHGGTADQTGAPPRDLSGATDPAQLSFRAHTQHVSASSVHAAFECTACHTKPSDVLSTDHVFDSTPGRAEVVFSGGLSSAGIYDGNGSCRALYCHGNGRGNNGSYRQTQAAPGCQTCHPQAGLGGRHGDHLGSEVGASCYDCHADTVNAAGSIVSPARHVDGHKDVRFAAAAMSFSGGGCTGSCHGQRHAEVW